MERKGEQAEAKDAHYCEFCGREDTHLPEGCHCADGRTLPSWTVGAILAYKQQPTEDER